ncbi:MAG: hypothetical protein EZS28_041840, partial [Streblomastix strix]
AEIMKGFDLKSAAEELKKLIRGDEEQKKQIILKQEGICSILIALIHDRSDDKLRKEIINCGIIDSLLYIFSSRTNESNTITRPYTQCFCDIIHPSNNENNQLVYDKKPYHGLIKLLSNTNDEILEDAVRSLNYIICDGILTKSTSTSSSHPHYAEIEACQGSQKLFQLFKLSKNKTIVNNAALCIGNMFKDHEIPNKDSMRELIIAHLKCLLYNSDQQNREDARISLLILIENQSNRSEILKNQFLKKIADELNQEFKGNKQQNEIILQQQDNDCLFLISMLDNRKDDILRKDVINSAGQNKTLQSSNNPEYTEFVRCKGIDRLSSLFMKHQSKAIVDHSALCLAYLYRTQTVPQKDIGIIKHLKSLVTSPSQSINNAAVNYLNFLAYNDDNRAEIMKGFDLKSAAEELKKLIRGDEEQKKQIILKQEGICSIL